MENFQLAKQMLERILDDREMDFVLLNQQMSAEEKRYQYNEKRKITKLWATDRNDQNCQQIP